MGKSSTSFIISKHKFNQHYFNQLAWQISKSVLLQNYVENEEIGIYIIVEGSESVPSSLRHI
jgi:hypothetical protein